VTKLNALSPHRLERDFSTRNGYQKNPRLPTSGFSLVEIMVGMVIGMLGIIVIMQVFALFEGQKRTTSGGGEAQNTGAIALSGLSDDIRQSGYGFDLLNLIGCDVLLRTGVTIKALAPVTINSGSVPAGDANTDTLLIAYGNSDTLPEANSISVQVLSATNFGVQAAPGFLVGDYVIATPRIRSCVPANPPVTILNKVQVVDIPNLTVTIAPGVATYASLASGLLFDLGPGFTVHAYAVRNNSLTMCDFMANDCSSAANTGNAAIWVPIAGNIVGLRAQYGQDITNQSPTIVSPNTGLMDGIVDIYSQTPPGNTGVTADACGWLRTLSVRLALVARNSQYEKTAVTTAAPVWAGSTNTNNDPSWGGSTAGASANPIDLTRNPNGTLQPIMSDGTYNWQHYRYKVFQTTLPLRNITSSVSLGKLSGC
jgi:type IV pilus assembly protein PilW